MSAPVFLPPGRRLGIFSPAGPGDDSDLRLSIKVLEDLGYKVARRHERFESTRHYLAGSDRDRAKSLTSFWKMNSVDAFLSRRGGYGCQRLLPALGDWSGAPDGKPVIGFSDLTALHLARFKFRGVGGWHTDMADSIHNLPPPELKAFLDGLSGRGPREWRFPKGDVMRTGRRAIKRGPVLGGNLSTICALLGTPWLPSFNGAILMLEDVNEKDYRLDRLFSTLCLSSAIDDVSGLVFGSFTGCGLKGLVNELLREAAGRLPSGVPVVKEAPFGHFTRNWPWWVGETAELFIEPGGQGVLRFLGF